MIGIQGLGQMSCHISRARLRMCGYQRDDKPTGVSRALRTLKYAIHQPLAKGCRLLYRARLLRLSHRFLRRSKISVPGLRYASWIPRSFCMAGTMFLGRPGLRSGFETAHFLKPDGGSLVGGAS